MVFKHSLITITIVVIAVWVNPAITDNIDDLQGVIQFSI